MDLSCEFALDQVRRLHELLNAVLLGPCERTVQHADGFARDADEGGSPSDDHFAHLFVAFPIISDPSSEAQGVIQQLPTASCMTPTAQLPGAARPARSVRQYVRSSDMICSTHVGSAGTAVSSAESLTAHSFQRTSRRCTVCASAYGRPHPAPFASLPRPTAPWTRADPLVHLRGAGLGHPP